MNKPSARDTPSHRKAAFYREWAENCLVSGEPGFFVYSTADLEAEEDAAWYEEIKEYWLVNNTEPITNADPEHKAIFLLTIAAASERP